MMTHSDPGTEKYGIVIIRRTYLRQWHDPNLAGSILKHRGMHQKKNGSRN